MKRILFAVMLMITSVTVFAQKKEVLHNQFSDYVQFRKDQQHGHHFGPQQFPIHPKPLSVTVKKDVVIVVFKKEDFLKLRPMVREKLMYRERPRSRAQQIFIEKMEH